MTDPAPVQMNVLFLNCFTGSSSEHNLFPASEMLGQKLGLPYVGISAADLSM